MLGVSLPRFTPTEWDEMKLNLAKPTVSDGTEYWVIEWAEYRELLRDACLHNRHPNLSAHNLSNWKRLANDYGYWHGYSRDEIVEWLTVGYQVQGLQGVGEFMPPIREKRRYIYADEGDEFMLDMAYSGDDNYMGSWTKRDTIPGIALNFSFVYQAGVSAHVMNAYAVWACKVAYSLESAGIDCEINVSYPGMGIYAKGGGYSRCGSTRSMIRVKREGSAVDFAYWTPILSPACFRKFGHMAYILHAHAAGDRAYNSGGSSRAAGDSWVVRGIPERRSIEFECPWTARNFPEEQMTADFRRVLMEMK